MELQRVPQDLVTKQQQVTHMYKVPSLNSNKHITHLPVKMQKLPSPQEVPSHPFPVIPSLLRLVQGSSYRKKEKGKVTILGINETTQLQYNAECVCAKLLQSCSTLCDPKDCSLPGFSVHGISQARILE